MSPQSTAFSLIAMASLLSSSMALPLDTPRSYSIVNVDGSSSPTTTSTPPAVTIVNTVTAPGASAVATNIVTAPGSVSITTVNVDSATTTVYVTVVPIPITTPLAPLLPIPSAPLPPMPSAPLLPIPSAPLPQQSVPSAPLLQPVPSAPLPPPPFVPLPPTVPHGCGHPPVNSNSTSSPRPDCPCSSSTKAAIIPSAAKSSKSSPEVVGDGAPWRHGYTLTPTSTSPTAHATGSYKAPVAARPSGMTAPFPVLPPAAPYWFNSTEIPNARRRIVVS